MLKYSKFAEECSKSLDSLLKLSDDDLLEAVKTQIDLTFNDDPCDTVSGEGEKEKMDTFGNLVDKLAIVTTRMWHAQDDLYRYRRMSKEKWTEEFKDCPDKVRTTLARACDLNLQRNQLMDEIDKLFLESLGMDDEERKKLIAKKWKSY